MGDAIWNFILAVYKARWDVLYTDQKSNMLRAKISSKFTPRIPPTNGNNKKRFQNQSQSLSIKLRPFPLYQPNPRRRSMSSPNTSNPQKPLSKTMLKGLMST